MRVPCHPVVETAALSTVKLGPSDTADATPFGIRADLLIPGRGEPIKHGAVIVRDGRIAWVGPYTDLPSEYHGGPGGSVKFTHVPVVMPGMWDLHTHFGGLGRDVRFFDDPKSLLPGASVLAGAITVEDLRRTLEAGFTSIRELAGCAGYLAPGVNDGYIVGPNIYSSIAILSVTGGHGDIHDCLLDSVVQAGHAGGPFYLCDGVAECIKAVRVMVRQGAKCIKVCSSGGVLSLNDDPEDRQFSDEELKAIVDEAARTGRRVAAHAIGKAGILAALRAGITSIEHGCYLDEEVASLMKEKGAILIATRHIQESLLKDHDGFPAKVVEKIEKIVPLTRANYDLAVKLGVRIALGTDMWNSDPAHPIAHGKNGMELHYASKAGMKPLDIIEACTATSPEVLGKLAPLSGQLKEGYDADLIAVSTSPLDNIDILTKPDNVTHVWRAGRLYKSPSRH
ncbi:amidohydrolase family protein [Microdochium nivale]|nr:amidohydrolase family protein [Microdochium nivale]